MQGAAMTGSAGSEPSARDQALTLIDYLLAFEAFRHPPVRKLSDHRLFRLSSDSLPDHPAVRMHIGDQPWLSVDFVDLPRPPEVPAAVARVLVDGPRLKPDVAPAVKPCPVPRTEASTTPPDALTEEEATRDADAEVARGWIETIWHRWSQEWRLADSVKRLHRNLFEQRELLTVDRDTYEMVWGFGNLTWIDEAQAPPVAVDHPLLVVPVEVGIDSRTQRLTVRPAGAIEVETRTLNGLSVHDRAGLSTVRQEVADVDVDPWDPEGTVQLYQRLVRAVDDRGAVGPPEHDGDESRRHATIDPRWSLFLRRRVSNSEGFLLDMRTLYRDQVDVIPPPLRGILTNEDPGIVDQGPDDDSRRPGEELLLLPLPANEQQERILRRSRQHPGVVVQGPPGTGKSHTIANLISHYVAEGKRVLVTAEKEQALKVLADKVPEEIRDLTVSVLGADEEGRRRLGESIRNIQVKVGLVDRRVADERISSLIAVVDRLDRRFGEVTSQLRLCRRSELRRLPGRWAAGDDITPQVAADWLCDHGEWGYVPDPISTGVGCPLTPDELAELVGLFRAIGPVDALEALLDQPPIGELPQARELNALLRERDSGQDAADRARRLMDGEPPVTDDLAAAAGRLAAELRAEARWRRAIGGTWRAGVLAQSADPRLAAEWAELAVALNEIRHQIFDLRSPVRAHNVRLPDSPAPDLESRLIEAQERLGSGRKLGVFQRDAKAAVDACRVDGHVPVNADQIQLCLDALTVESSRHRLATRWYNQTNHVGAPPLVGLPEEAVADHLHQLEEIRQAAERRRTLAIRTAELRLPPLSEDPDGLERLAALAGDLSSLARRREIESALEELRRLLEQGAGEPRAAPGWGQLADALAAADTTAWDLALTRIRSLQELVPRVTRRRSLMDKLAAVAPLWSAAIESDVERAGSPDTLDLAWQWRQLETWVRSVVEGPSPSALQSELEAISVERRKTITELVTEKAWRRLVDNLGHPQRQALEEYVQASRRFGKTGGKHASRWIAEMRRAMANATTAVPVWIMPTSRALVNFRPAAAPPFDVLIIDEASQIGMTALPLLALARTAIVVGDDQQTSPENVGLDREPAYRLMDDHLRRIPGYRTVFDPDRSLYDLALLRFSRPIMLTEHFRCLPRIIEFSNQLAYNGRIDALRDRPPRPGWRAVRTRRVPDGFRRGDANPPEAEAVVGLLGELDADPDYLGKTFGVISLLGTSQTRLIKELAYDTLGPGTMERRQIRVGEPATFQGDERDVILISTVVADDPSKDRTRIGAMTKEADKRRINVAASRARDQMWVVTSVDASAFSPGDFRAALLTHCSESGSVEGARDNLLERCESEFERRVVRLLLARGYTDVTVQHRVGQYRLDIVVSGPDSRLAIECDGDRWHTEAEWDRDRGRQQVLERAGWTFERIRGSAFFRDPEVAMEPVWARLNDLGIPLGDWRSALAEPTLGVADPAVDGTAPAHPVAAERAEGEVGRSEVHNGDADDDFGVDGDSTVAPVDEAAETAGDLEPSTPSWSPPAWYRPPDEEPPPVDRPEAPVTPAPVAPGPPSWYRPTDREEPSPIDPQQTDPNAAPEPGPPAWYVAMLAQRDREDSTSSVSSSIVDLQGTTITSFQEAPGPDPQFDDPPVRASLNGIEQATSGEGTDRRVPSPEPTVAMAPYRVWRPRHTPDVTPGNLGQITDGVVEIVTAEGPIHVDRVYHLYVRAAGGQRVGREIRRVLDSAVHRAVRRHQIGRVRDRYAPTGSSTLYVADSPAVVLRERGPRELFDIPRGEIQALMVALGEHLSSSELKRAVLREWGFGRLTEKAETYLNECLGYRQN